MVDYLRHFWTYPSSYVILILWGSSGFGYQPGFATFILHFVITPAILLFALALAHHEGIRKS
jgi:hypothetical protein